MTASFYTRTNFDLYFDYFDYIDNHKRGWHRQMPLPWSLLSSNILGRLMNSTLLAYTWRLCLKNTGFHPQMGLFAYRMALEESFYFCARPGLT